MPNYNYVIDSTYKPYSLQEMLMPLEAYREAYNQAEEKYLNLSKGASVFEYLSNTLPKDSEARQLYEKYANDLEAQAKDFETNGLNISNGSALTSLRRRYDKEIGRLERADAVLKEIQKDIKEKGPSHLWENEMPTMDDILRNPNYINWGISGDELYNKGAIVGKNFSSRIYNAGDGGRTLGGYYRDFIERVGIDPDRLNDFQREMLLDGFAEEVSSIPELKEAALSILETTGASEHLRGNTLNRALKQVVRGIVDNAVYTESHKPVIDRGVVDATSMAQMDRADARVGIVRNKVTGKLEYDKTADPSLQREKEILNERARLGLPIPGTGGNNGGSGISTQSYEKGTWHISNFGGRREDISAKGEDVPARAKEIVFERDSEGTLNAYIRDKHLINPSDKEFGKIGSITKDGVITVNENKDTLMQYTGFGANDNDVRNIRLMLGDAWREGPNNNLYFLDMDKANSWNHSGGFYRKRLDVQSVRNNDSMGSQINNSSLAVPTPIIENPYQTFDPAAADAELLGNN